MSRLQTYGSEFTRRVFVATISPENPQSVLTHNSRIDPPPKVVSIDSGGHRERVLARRDELVRENLSLVPPIATRVFVQVPSAFALEDLIGFGNLGLVHAATRYRPCAHGGAPFSAFARPRIHGSIVDSMRRNKWRDSTLDPLPEDATDRIADTRDRTEAEIDERRIRSLLMEALTWLTPREREVIHRIYAGGEQLIDVGRALGISTCLVKRERNRALDRLLQRLRLAGTDRYTDCA